MHTTHPTILIDFVPGGCTGIVQPCDVGIQCPFKHITNQAFHEDIINVTLIQIDQHDVSLNDVLTATHHEDPPARRWVSSHPKPDGGLTTVADVRISMRCQCPELEMRKTRGERWVEGRGRGKQ